MRPVESVGSRLDFRATHAEADRDVVSDHRHRVAVDRELLHTAAFGARRSNSRPTQSRIFSGTRTPHTSAPRHSGAPASTHTGRGNGCRLDPRMNRLRLRVQRRRLEPVVMGVASGLPRHTAASAGCVGSLRTALPVRNAGGGGPAFHRATVRRRRRRAAPPRPVPGGCGSPCRVA